MSLKYNGNNIPYAKHLRKNATPQENHYYTDEGKQKDEFRTEVLEKYDLSVIRFTNRQINNNFDGVCKYIDMVVKNSLSR